MGALYSTKNLEFPVTDYVIELEQQKSELLEALKNIVGTCKNFASNVDINFQKEVLKKY